MKRYRVLGFDFDSRAHSLTNEIRDEWEEQVKQLHRENRRKVREGLIAEFGVYAYEEKIDRFAELGPKPFSVVAFHNRFQDQARAAYVMGAFYPALTGACALGERILNHLILTLRENYTSSPEYKKVYRKDSFDDWRLAIDTLVSWGVLVDGAADAFRELGDLRNRALHFRPETDTNDRELAREAIAVLDRTISSQFGAFGTHPWFLSGAKGESYIARDSEDEPFVKAVFLPNCAHVGPNHNLDLRNGRWVVHDREDYPERDVDDVEFVRLRTEAMKNNELVPTAR